MVLARDASPHLHQPIGASMDHHVVTCLKHCSQRTTTGNIADPRQALYRGCLWRRVTAGDEAPLPWLTGQLLDITARSARGTAAIAVRLCSLLAAAPVVAEQYEAVLLRLLTYAPPLDTAAGGDAEARRSPNQGTAELPMR